MALTRAKLEELIANGDIDVGGGLSNPMPNTDLIVNLNADKLDGYHASDLMLGNPNILHNWDFRNPVNQRNVSGTISTGTYFYDRWIRNNGTVTTNADYLTIGATAEIEQRIEGSLLAGETVTVSVMVGGTVFSGTGIMPTSSGTVSVTITGWGTATLGYATGYMYVRLAPTAASNVVRVKLELGTASTLAYDPPMDWAVELPKCQRYFESFIYTDISPVCSGFFSGTDRALGVFNYCNKRTIPTFTFSGVFRVRYGSSTNVVLTGIEVINPSQNTAFISGTGSGFPSGDGCIIRGVREAVIALSSDL